MTADEVNMSLSTASATWPDGVGAKSANDVSLDAAAEASSLNDAYRDTWPGLTGPPGRG